MEIELVLPVTTGEWLAFLAALAATLTGLWLLLAPGSFLTLLNVGRERRTKALLSETRGALGGMWFGLGLACLLLSQPLVYLALGLALVCAVAGRLLSMIFDRAINPFILAATAFEALMAFFAVANVFGLVS